MDGYSQTSLANKLGLKDGYVIRLINQPAYYRQLFPDWPDVLELKQSVEPDFIHYFETSAKKLATNLPHLASEIKKTGMIWVSWPKKLRRNRSSPLAEDQQLETDINEQTIRDVCLPLGLVDIKVCAIDETWSGLKLVWRKEFR